MCPSLFALESVPKNDDNIFFRPQERRQSSCFLLWGKSWNLWLWKSSWKHETRVGLWGECSSWWMGKGRVQGPAAFGTLRGWPAAGGKSMRTWGEDTQPRSLQFGSQGRGSGSCVGPEGVGAMNIQGAHPCISCMGTDSGDHDKWQTREPFLDYVIPGVLAWY